MRLLIILIAICFSPFRAQADNKTLYQQLDSAIAHLADYYALKDKKLKDIKLSTTYITDAKEKLRLYEQLVHGYTPFIYDSAMVYVQKGTQLAQQTIWSIITSFRCSRPDCMFSEVFILRPKSVLKRSISRHLTPYKIIFTIVLNAHFIIA